MKLLKILMCFVLVFALASVTADLAFGQEKKGGKMAGMDRLSGTIRMMNKDTSTITLRTRQNVDRQVVYSEKTLVSNMNKPGGSISDLKEGVRVICLGKYEGVKLMAARIDIREGK